MEGQGPSLTFRGLLLGGIMLENKKQTKTTKKPGEESPAQQRNTFTCQFMASALSPIVVNMVEMVDVVGWVVPLVPHSGGG